MCEDYRASASVDLKIDHDDIKAREEDPLASALALWAGKGLYPRLFDDVLGIWKRKAPKSAASLSTVPTTSGKCPKETLAELQAFLKS